MREFLDPELLINAYCQGYFPMAESDEEGNIYWHCPDPRAIIPFENIKPSRSMRKVMKDKRFEIRTNTAFEEVVRACALRDETWISDDIVESYVNLNNLKLANSVEAWLDGNLVGGLYGVTLGGAFFGESMFSLKANASKAAFYFLAERLIKKGFMLLDTQYITEHTERLGAVEIPKSQYLVLLEKALKLTVRFDDSESTTSSEEEQ